MRDLMGVHIGRMVKDEEEVFLCFDWEQNREEEGLCRIKARYGNRKFFTTGFETKDIDSIMLLRWKNDANGHSYEMRKPQTRRDGNLIRIDLTKEFAAMGLESNEPNEKAKRGGGSRNFRAYGNWIHVGECGYYESEYDGWENDYLNFCFAYPGVKIGNSLVTKIEIVTSDNIKDKNMEPFYDFMRIIMDDLSAVSRYTENEIAELFTKHLPKSMRIEIWCKDKLIRAAIDHVGSPARRFCKEDIVDGVRNSNTPWIKTENPLELVVKELDLQG